MLIEPGMAVQGTDGTIGTVAEVVADQDVDVFRGLVVTHGLILHKRIFVQPEQVVSVVGSTVSVSLSKDEAEGLPPPASTA